MNGLRFQVNKKIRYLLSQQDRDPLSPSYGCFDRKYWAWKLVDFPEATFQRNIHSMALAFSDPRSPYFANPFLRDSALAGLIYATKIQHRNGSFDQAFPNEQSFGATAFLLHPLSQTFYMFYRELAGPTRKTVENCLRKGADFLCNQNEEHGHIANHLSGAALSLLTLGTYFKSSRYRFRAQALIDRVLNQQSHEGWFLEYEGADPGYQTLCLYYLAQIYTMEKDRRLYKALERAVDFVAHFVHPDGTFAGEYGSRRTGVFYPGGIAMLADELPMAMSVYFAMKRSIREGKTVTLLDVDMGNLAPLLSNYICSLQTELSRNGAKMPTLPRQEPNIVVDFREAGLHIRGTKRYYAIVGLSNGGVLKVWDKTTKRIVWDDGGYVGRLRDGTVVSTQATKRDRYSTVGDSEVDIHGAFRPTSNRMPTPSNFLLLRMLNLTLMRNVSFGNWVKKRLVHFLVTGGDEYAIRFHRRLKFEKEQIRVFDTIRRSSRHKFLRLECGRTFCSIHMASARYFEGARLDTRCTTMSVDVRDLNKKGFCEVNFVISSKNA